MLFELVIISGKLAAFGGCIWCIGLRGLRGREACGRSWGRGFGGKSQPGRRDRPRRAPLSEQKGDGRGPSAYAAQLYRRCRPCRLCALLRTASVSRNSASIFLSSISAAARLALPSSAICRLSSMVPIKIGIGLFDRFDIKHAALHFLADHLVAVAQVLGVGCQQLVGQIIGIAHGGGGLGERWMVTAWASCVSQSGTVLTRVELILVTRDLSFSCTKRIEGSDCMVT